MNGTPLPAALEVRELLEGLVGRDFDTKTGGPMVDPAKGACVAEYVDDQMQLAAIIAADLGLASAAGSAIGLIPAKEVEASVKYKEMSAAQIENFSEILNVMASLFNVDGAPHLRLTNVTPPGQALAADAQKLLMAYVPRLDVTMEIPGYGGGALSVVVAPD